MTKAGYIRQIVLTVNHTEQTAYVYRFVLYLHEF